MEDKKSKLASRYESIKQVVSPQLVNIGNVVKAELMMYRFDEEDQERLQKVKKLLREADDLLHRR